MTASRRATGRPKRGVGAGPVSAARLYAGAVEATAMTKLTDSPRAPTLRPFPPAASSLGSPQR